LVIADALLIVGLGIVLTSIGDCIAQVEWLGRFRSSSVLSLGRLPWPSWSGPSLTPAGLRLRPADYAPCLSISTACLLAIQNGLRRTRTCPFAIQTRLVAIPTA
jgi:hypothetical protein